MKKLSNILIENSNHSNESVVNGVITHLTEKEAVQTVLRVIEEPTLSGDLKELSKKII